MSMSATCPRHDTECRRLGNKTTRRHPTYGAKDERAIRTRILEIKEEDVVVYRDVASGKSLVLPSTRPRKKKMKKSRSNGNTAQKKLNDEVVSSATNVVLQRFLAIGAFTLIVLLVSVLTSEHP